MGRAGWEIPAPPASMFAWAPIPEAYREAGSMLFSKLLIEEAGVAVAPGVGFGEYGEGYLRFSVANSLENLQQALDRIDQWTKKNL